MRYRCFLILVGLLLIISTIGCDQKKTNSITEQDGKYNFEIYLVKGEKQATEDLSKIQLKNKPVITEDDIITYYWDKHILKMKKGIIEERVGSIPVAGRRFVLVVKGERIYSGNFWTAISSCWLPDTPIIYKEGTLGGHEIKEEVNQNEQLYSIVYEGNLSDPRNDKRIYNALKEIGVLKE